MATSQLTIEQQGSPRLSHRRLTMMLVAMCAIPILTIACLWTMLPPVFEGQLQASVYTEGLPGEAFYEVDYDQRPPFEGGFLVVQNNSDVDWTQINIQVNKHYQIYDIEPIPANSERRFQLSRFLTRAGARFSLRYNRLKSVRVYARRPTADRATFYHEFE